MWREDYLISTRLLTLPARVKNLPSSTICFWLVLVIASPSIEGRISTVLKSILDIPPH